MKKDRDRHATPPDRLPLKFVGGDPSLDLVNTVDWTEHGLEAERLHDYSDLVRWGRAAGVLEEEQARRLRRSAEGNPRRALAVLREAYRVRTLLARLFRTVTSGTKDAAPWREFDRLLTRTLTHLRLRPGSGSGAAASWQWHGDDRLDSVLWPVVRAAAALLSSEEASRIRVCADPSCGWMFVDRSRNGLRRWCQMSSCGTWEKTRRRRRRGRPKLGGPLPRKSSRSDSS
jgi:predicted RNA-binding Zn ribbon-like protein